MTSSIVNLQSIAFSIFFFIHYRESNMHECIPMLALNKWTGCENGACEDSSQQVNKSCFVLVCLCSSMKESNTSISIHN